MPVRVEYPLSKFVSLPTGDYVFNACLLNAFRIPIRQGWRASQQVKTQFIQEVSAKHHVNRLYGMLNILTTRDLE